jgi:hypothetical protein
MKKDKYEQLKPEAFQYEGEKLTPTLLFACVASIVVMFGFLILFVMFVMALFSQVPNII